MAAGSTLRLRTTKRRPAGRRHSFGRIRSLPFRNPLFPSGAREQVEGTMLSGMAEFVIFGFMPLMVGVLAGRGRAEGAASTITGSIAIPPCDPLPESALVAI